ncbi:hypothetical protein [Azospirillum sp. sgz301742]
MAEYKPRADDGATPKPTMAAQHLRADIDRGRTGDKIPVDDPAAAPLGTDDEAAGTRPAESALPRAGERHPSPPPGHAKGYENGPGRGLGIAVASMLAVILVVLALVMVAG